MKYFDLFGPVIEPAKTGPGIFANDFRDPGPKQIQLKATLHMLL